MRDRLWKRLHRHGIARTLSSGSSNSHPNVTYLMEGRAWNWPGGRPPKSVLDVAWTDPQWRSAGPEGDPDTRCGDAHRPAPQSTSPRSVARCARGLGHVGVHAGPDFDGAPHQWETTS